MYAKHLLILVAVFAITSAAALAIVTQPLTKPVSSTPVAVNEARLKQHVKHLSVDLYPRSFEQFRNIELAAQYIQKEFTIIGANVEIQNVQVQETTYKNIIAHFGPKSGPLLVIGAHYDSHGDANEGAKYPSGFSPETHTPGADDNASGIAGLIELARLLQQHPPPHPVDLVAYTLEEPPHFRTENMGSAWHAHSLAAAHRDVSLMISLEMIGFYNDEKDSQHYPMQGMDLVYPDRGNFIAVVGRLSDFGATRKVKALMSGATELPVYSINAPSLIPGIDFSDHINYWYEGYPAIMITDTAFYRNPNYHRAGDTYDKLDYKRMTEVVQGVYRVAEDYTLN